MRRLPLVTMRDDDYPPQRVNLSEGFGLWLRSEETMEHQSTITAMPGHGIKAGDWITITERDARWWRRLVHWMLRKQGYPQRTIKRRVSQASETTLPL